MRTDGAGTGYILERIADFYCQWIHSDEGSLISKGIFAGVDPFQLFANGQPQVCEVVRSYAFKRTTLPLIVSLEVHCSPTQQEIVCELIHDYWGEYLHRLPDDFSDTTPLPPLEHLRKRILVSLFMIFTLC